MSAGDFVLKDGVLEKYLGPCGDVVIPDSVTSIGDRAFEYCSDLTSIVIPDGVSSIGDGAFWCCSSLTSISIPESVVNIGRSAFEGCHSLTSISIPESVVNINRSTFEDCHSLTSIKIPDSVTSIGDRAFNHCDSLTSVTIPGSITSIGMYAFCDCCSLKSITIPSSITRIGDGAFDGCPLTRMEIADGASFTMGPIFGQSFPKGLADQFSKLLPFMDVKCVKEYFVPGCWEKLPEDFKARVFLTYQDARMRSLYKKLLKPADLNPFSEAILRQLGTKLTKKECGIVAEFIKAYLPFLDGPRLKAMYDVIAAQKKRGIEALEALDANAGLKRKMAADSAPKADRGPRTQNDIAFDNMGFDDAGVKIYDLGKKQVHAVLQPNCDILIFDPATGETSGTIPRKGTDRSLYTAAAADCKALGKAVKTLLAACRDSLYKLYLAADELPVSDWKAEWTGNPITRALTSMVVWQQGDGFFTLEGDKTVLANGTPYALSNEPVRVACTADMGKEIVAAWQRRFIARKQKQPFLQIWEPIRKLGDIQKDRYAGCIFHSHAFYNQRALGMKISTWEAFDELASHCQLTLENFAIEQKEVTNDSALKIVSIQPLKWDRRSNAVISFLDKACAYEKIHNDDAAVAEWLDQFTPAQIEEFIKLASDNNCPNCTAALLEFKNAHFADFDPMAEFTLD